MLEAQFQAFPHNVGLEAVLGIRGQSPAHALNNDYYERVLLEHRNRQQRRGQLFACQVESLSVRAVAD